MPIYEYRCRTCGATFEERRPMDDADHPGACPSGHLGAARLLPVFATIGSASQSGGFPGACGDPVPGGCGAGCACHAG